MSTASPGLALFDGGYGHLKGQFRSPDGKARDSEFTRLLDQEAADRAVPSSEFNDLLAEREPVSESDALDTEDRDYDEPEEDRVADRADRSDRDTPTDEEREPNQEAEGAQDKDSEFADETVAAEDTALPALPASNGRETTGLNEGSNPQSEAAAPGPLEGQNTQTAQAPSTADQPQTESESETPTPATTSASRDPAATATATAAHAPQDMTLQGTPGVTLASPLEGTPSTATTPSVDARSTPAQMGAASQPGLQALGQTLQAGQGQPNLAKRSSPAAPSNAAATAALAPQDMTLQGTPGVTLASPLEGTPSTATTPSVDARSTPAQMGAASQPGLQALGQTLQAGQGQPNLAKRSSPAAPSNAAGAGKPATGMAQTGFTPQTQAPVLAPTLFATPQTAAQNPLSLDAAFEKALSADFKLTAGEGFGLASQSTSATPVSAEQANQFTRLAAEAAGAPQQARSPLPPTLPASKVAGQIAQKALSDGNRFEIRLDPPELGRIEVRMEINGSGRVEAHLIVEEAHTLDLMERDVRALEKALREQGLELEEGALNLSLKDQTADGSDAQAQDWRHFEVSHPGSPAQSAPDSSGGLPADDPLTRLGLRLAADTRINLVT